MQLQHFTLFSSATPCLVAIALLAPCLSGCMGDKAADLSAATSSTVTTQVPPVATGFRAQSTVSRAPAAPFSVQSTSVRTLKPELSAPKIKYTAGEDPAFAKSCGWPVTCAEPLPGAILPAKRIVAYYGNPLSKRMGALGEFEKDEMLRRLNDEVQRWEKADPD